MRKLTIQAAKERLLEQLDRSSECWIWTGPTTTGGYGILQVVRWSGLQQSGSLQRQYTVITEKPTRALTELRYMLFVGPIPEGRHTFTTSTPRSTPASTIQKLDTPCIRNHSANWRNHKTGRPSLPPL